MHYHNVYGFQMDYIQMYHTPCYKKFFLIEMPNFLLSLNILRPFHFEPHNILFLSLGTKGVTIPENLRAGLILNLENLEKGHFYKKSGKTWNSHGVLYTFSPS